jgi:excinuclease ABC subunit A
MNQWIQVRGAREHNLKGINVDIEKNKMTVITGLSGSGKSSLAFDTIYAEGQRRFIDSLSTYARNFLLQLNKPDVDSINGLCPSIAIDQKTVGHSPRSTVGTITEVYDYLRLLYSKVGTPMCPTHKIPVEGQPLSQIKETVLGQYENEKIIILAPVAKSKKGEFKKEIDSWLKAGYLSAKIDGEWVYLDSVQGLKKTLRHDIDIVMDKMTFKNDEDSLQRVSQAIGAAVALTDGLVTIENKKGDRKNFSTRLACPECGYSFTNVDPLLFSFNNPKGACETCNGLGTTDIYEYEVSEHIAGVGQSNNIEYKLDSDNPDLEWKDTTVCKTCNGSGLKEAALNVLFEEKNIFELSQMSISSLAQFFNHLSNLKHGGEIAEQIIPEIISRIDYLEKVGAGYLSLSRRSKTLSGGEAQRIRLASQVGTPLVGVLYVLDEPSIGLHPRDHQNVLSVLNEIKNRGNTIIVVEHDEDTIRAADQVIDIGPKAGRLGGELLFSGDFKDLKKSKGLTGDYISGRRSIAVPHKRRSGLGHSLSIRGASGNNLKNVDVDIPLGKLIGVTGVSGSGKSTLIIDTLYKSVANDFLKRSFIPSPYKLIKGTESLDSLIQIDQKPIGRTPRSCPATYVGVFPLIRSLFTQLPESKIRGYEAGRFSFNVKGGRCEACQGAGVSRVQMQFLSDVYVKCDVCQGKRYNPETLLVKYKGKNIHDVLSMTVEEAVVFFENHPPIRRKLETLMKVGLDYITLGQNSTTLSGGEAQRVKLSRELSKKISGHTLYILDEPTTGLHIHDVAKLVELLGELVDRDNTVVVVEHNLDVIKCCDHLIDLGPEGGESGGQLVYSGPTEGILNQKKSITAQYLKELIMPHRKDRYEESFSSAPRT